MKDITYTRPPFSKTVMWILWLFLGEVGLIRLLLHRKYGWTMMFIFIFGSFIVIGPIITEIWNIVDAFHLNKWLRQGVQHTSQEKEMKKEHDNGKSYHRIINDNIKNIKSTSKSSKNFNRSIKQPSSRMAKILQQLRQYGFSKFDTKLWVRREIKSLPEILDKNEDIKGALNGFINHKGYKDDGQTTVLLLTPKRLIFLNSGLFISNANNEISLDEITGISSSSRWLGNVTINASGDNITINGLTSTVCRPFVKEARKLSLRFKQKLYNGNNNTQPKEDNLDKLAKAKKLLDNKIITEQDFKREKEKLL